MLLIIAWVLQVIASLILMDYEDVHFEGWNWDGISHWLSAKSPGFQAAWWVSLIGTQVGFQAGVLLIGLGLFRWYKSRRAG